ncbi:MAG: ABC transporter permease [Candidatus Heimdallarchaeota archaeon]|nr:ABC transporter permease [Candidatus Heimdallarchaeota archaeon]
MTIFLNLITIIMYFFFSKLNPDLTIFGISSSYLEFVFLGLCLQMIIGTTLATVCGSLYNEIVTGTWSTLLLNFNFLEYSIGNTLAGVSLSSVSVIIALLLASLFMGSFYVVSFQEILLILVLFLLILLSHMVISMLFTSFTIYYQKNSGLIPLLYQLTKTFTGVVFPIALLKGFPLFLSRILPLTYGLEALQAIALSETIDWKLILTNSGILVGMIIILGILSYFLVSWSIQNSKSNNKVDWY